MKKIIISIISVAVLLSVALVAFFVFGMQEENLEPPKQPTTYEILSKAISSEEGDFPISKLRQKDIFSDLSYDNLKQVFEAFELIIEKNETIVFKDTIFMRFLFERNGVKHTLSDESVNLRTIYTYEENGIERVLNYDGTITVSTEENAECLKYAMLVEVYTELFPDNWTYGYTGEQIQKLSSKWIPRIHVYPDYAEYGFENALDAFEHREGPGRYTLEYFAFGFDVKPYNSETGTALETFMDSIERCRAVNEKYLFEKKVEES